MGLSTLVRRAAIAAIVVAAIVVAVVVVVVARGADDDPAVVAGSDGVELVPGGLTRQPSRLPDRGAYVDAVVQPDGSVQVTHWLRAAEGIDEVEVSAFPTQQVTGPAVVSDLEVRTSQGEVRLPETPEIGADPLTVPLVRPTLLVQLTYTLQGVSRADEGSAVGRAVLDSTYADVDYARERGSVRVQLSGRRILTLSCFPEDSGVGDQRACGGEREGGWAVNLTRDQAEDKVLAQVDLDRARAADPDPSLD